MSSDRYDEGYATKLWHLLPELYRAEDSTDVDHAGPLEEIVRRIGAQVAIVRRSVDRLWEDQAIESCDDWVIPYLGDLLATNLVASLDARGKRLDVAKTIYYRRRKGTLALAEELAADVTGWSVRVVEMFRRLGRTRHALDPAIGRPGMPLISSVVARAGSTGTLHVVGAPLGNHAVRIRIGTAGQAGTATWSVSVDGGVWLPQGAARSATIELPGGGEVTISLVDGTGAPSFLAADDLAFAIAADRVMQLQRAQSLVGTRTRTPAGGLADLREVLGARESRTAFDEFSHTVDVRRGRGMTGWHDIPRLGVFVWRLRSLALEQVTPVKHVSCAGHFTFDPTGRDIPLFAAGDRASFREWISPGPHQLPGPLTDEVIADQLTALYRTDDELRSFAIYRVTGGVGLLVPRAEVAARRRDAGTAPWIDAVRGRVIWSSMPAGTELRVDCHQGFSSLIGAGAYERPLIDLDPPQPPAVTPAASGGGALPTVQATDTLVIADSLTYTAPPVAPTIASLVLTAGDGRRPLLRLRPKPPRRWIITGAPGSRILLDGWVVAGNDIVLRGEFASVTLSCCTLDPGTQDPEHAPKWLPAADGRRLRSTWLRVEAEVGSLVLDRCITGPVVAVKGGRIESLSIRDSIVQAAHPGAAAIVANNEVELIRTTVLGPIHVHRLEASECIMTGHVEVDDCQHGCVRFSAYADGSVLPRPYESVLLHPGHLVFTSQQFGDPTFAQLADTAGDAIAAGAEDRSEMGAFWREKNAIKERSLLIKYQEFLPLGIEPVIVHVT